MPLRLTLADLGEVSEALQPLYKQRGDGAGWILDVEGGAVGKATLDEFRNKNIELMKRLNAAGDLDPEQVATIRAENAQLRGDLEKVRKGASAEAEARVKALEKSRDGLRLKLENVLIDGEVTKVASQLGAYPTAIDDVATRVRSRFRLDDDGRPVAVDAQGQTIYGEDGQPLGIEGAVRQLTSQAPHLFARSSGGRAAHTSASGGRITHERGNPWAKQSFNLTEQSRIMKTDRNEAARLAAEAGQTLDG